MKKISTLAFMAFFFCLGTMAQVVLGDIKFSIKDGQKLSPTTGKITVTFPNVEGVEDPTATSFVLTGAFNDIEFDGVEGTFAAGVTFDLAEFELEPSTDYALTITSVKVGDEELAPAEGYILNFKTRGAERKMSWTFQIDEDTKAKIIADDGNDPAFNESNGGTYWKCIKANERHYIHQSLKDSEIMLDADNVVPFTEDLTFTAGKDKMFVGDLSGSFAGMLVFNAWTAPDPDAGKFKDSNLKMTIPDCKVGDVIVFSGVNATTGKANKQTCIFTMNGEAIAPEGLESSTGLKDSVWVSGKGSFKFEAQIDGDISFYFGNFRMTSIEITEAQEKLPRNYNVVAQYQEDESIITLKELVAKTEGITGSTIKTQFPYWLADADGNVYKHDANNKEFNISFDLKNGEGDTTFVINYAKTEITGAVYLSEGEDIPGAVECTSANAAIRSSMGKAGYVTEDTKLVTLEPGTYKIKAIIFDAGKTPSYVCTLGVGANEEDDVFLSATATNWTEAESDLLTIETATDITLKAGGGDSTGLDVIVIYASEDAPDDPVLKGDANADSEINITDITYIIDKINNKAPENFNEEAADVNGDGEINITDVTLVLDIINAAK